MAQAEMEAAHAGHIFQLEAKKPHHTTGLAKAVPHADGLILTHFILKLYLLSQEVSFQGKLNWGSAHSVPRTLLT